MGVNHSTQGAETVNAINNLALLTGNIGKAGASPFSITGQCNAMGSRESSATSSLPGYRKFESPADREDLARLWNVSPDQLPTERGHAYPDIVEACVKGEIKALWIIATNPVVSFPNIEVLKQGFSNLDFLVVKTASTQRRPPNSPTRIARFHLGRKRRLHQLRTPRQQGQRHKSRPPARPARTSRSSGHRRQARHPRPTLPRLADPQGCL
jgi:hypothetical protein